MGSEMCIRDRCIPTFAVVWLVARASGARVVVDWHNFGYTVLAQNGGRSERSALVRVARAYERALGSRMDAHLCVTAAMAAWLKTEWGITAVVLYDRPPALFRPLAVAERHELFTRLPDFASTASTTLFTQRRG